VSAGKLFTNTLGLPGIHGATVAGIQGICCSTPKAAAVAAATVGFANDLHIPNGIMFAIGLKSIMFAIHFLLSIVGGFITIKLDGDAPKEHFKEALMQT
jgi:hypothetical protein